MLTELQSFVSYPESLQAKTDIPKISTLDSISHALAQSYATLIHHYFNDQEHWHVVFFQVGSALIAPLILKELQDSYPGTYNAVKFYVMDIHFSVVEELKAAEVLKRNPDKIQLYPPVELGNTVLPCTPDIIICDCGLSRIPSRKIRILEGKVYDTVQRTLGLPDHTSLKFESGKVRFIPENGYHSIEVLELQTLIQEQNITDGTYYYSAPLLAHIRGISELLPKHGVLFILDKETLVFPVISGRQHLTVAMPNTDLKLLTVTHPEVSVEERLEKSLEQL